MDMRELLKKLSADTAEELTIDEALFKALPDDFTRARLAGEGKVSKRDFEKWMDVDRYPLHWEAQIALLLTDEELDQVSGGRWGTNPGGGVIWIDDEYESEKPPFISPYEQ